MSIPTFEEIIEPNDQTAARAEHLDKLRELTGDVYPNKFIRSTLTGGEDTISTVKRYQAIVEVEAEMATVRANLKEGERPAAEIKDAINERLRALGNVRIAGRLTTPPRGNFVHLTDGIGKLQIYCKKGQFALVKNDGMDTPDEENAWTAWQMIDHGDFVGVDGYLFVTNTGEVSVHVEKLRFLAKAMLPMPDKMHGIEDPEIKQRQRYVDLIGSSLAVEHEGMTTREVFETRAKIISSMRRFLEDHGYVEVETPMLTPKATGAAAKPFKTHHNALDIDLYARIAPELYLKRLVVGGFEKVYELNRNFRNEGISYKHNPEFTMLEFYCAYMDVNGMMDFCEEMLRQSVLNATGQLEIKRTFDSLRSRTIDFSTFERLSMKDAIVRYLNPTWHELQTDEINSLWLSDLTNLRRLILFIGLINEELIRTGNRFQEAEKRQFGRLSQEYFPIATYFRRDEITENREIRLIVDSISNQADLWISTESLNVKILSDFEGELKKFHPNTIKVFKETINPKISRENQTALIIQYLFEELAESKLIQPTFIIDFPKSISPLSKASPENPQVAERFELFINGMEVANGFSELNDPKEQYERFVDQMAERERGDEEAMVLDEDYIRALSYGMPPAAGIGIGIDRLTMLLTNKHSIRDVILFPHMRPEKREGETRSGGEGE